MASAVNNSGTKGWLVSILELGAWVGVLLTGYLADKLSRKYTIVLGKSLTLVLLALYLHTISTAVCVFCVGVVVQSAAFKPSSIYGGRRHFSPLLVSKPNDMIQAGLLPVWVLDP